MQDFHISRRSLLRSACAGVLGAALPPLARAKQAAERPNVVVILSDDQGWGDLSVHRNVNLRTPNVDSLARDGALSSVRSARRRGPSS